MIIDMRLAENSARAHYDVVVIGAGPAGISLAMELEISGKRIAVLESGGLEFDDRAQALNEGRVTGLEETDLTAARLRWFGGASNHWGGHCLPLDRIDFERSPLSGLTGWPISYEEMTPYFQKANSYCDVGSLDYTINSLADINLKNDILLPNDHRIETRIIRQSKPTNFGEKFRSRFEVSKNVDLLLYATALSMNVDESGRANAVAIRTIEGQGIQIEAELVVLAGGAVENARFLLANNVEFGRNLGNRGEYLGACYMDHPVGGAAFLHLNSPVENLAYWQHATTNDGVEAHLVWRLSDKVLTDENLSNIQFFLIPSEIDESQRKVRRDAKASIRDFKKVGKWVIGRDREKIKLSEAYCNFVQNSDALAVHTYRQLTQGSRIERLLLRYESEQLPEKASYVALDNELRDAFGSPSPVLHWSPSLSDRDSIVRSAVTIGAITGESGLGRIELEDHFDSRYWDASTAWHQLGTTRMAESEGHGVVDPSCLLFGTKNVYVAGGSVFPSGGRANPTLTIVALAIRLADHLRTSWET